MLLPVGWSHRPAGHRPHHRHLSPKVTPPVVSAPAAPTPSSLHPSTHLSVHPPSSVSGVGSALATQLGTGQVGADLAGARSQRAGRPEAPLPVGTDFPPVPTHSCPGPAGSSVLGGERAGARAQGGEPGCWWGMLDGRVGAEPFPGLGSLGRPGWALGGSWGGLGTDPGHATCLQGQSGAAATCRAGVWVLYAVEQRGLKLSG